MATNHPTPRTALRCARCHAPSVATCPECGTRLCWFHLTWHAYTVEQFGALISQQLRDDRERTIRSTRGWVT
jgi:hypothetical protein